MQMCKILSSTKIKGTAPLTKNWSHLLKESMMGINIQHVDGQAYKLLGIYLDEHLSFDAHVNHFCKKLSRSLYCIKMAKNNINLPGLRALYILCTYTFTPILLLYNSELYD